MAASTKALREARANVRELRAAIAAGQAAEKAAAARAAPVAKRKAALAARLAKVDLLTQAAAQPNRNVMLHVGDTRRITLDDIHVGRQFGPDPIVAMPALAESLLAQGGTKVSLQGTYGGQDYTLRGMLARTRTTSKATIAALAAGQRKIRRAEEALHRAVAEVRTIYEAAFESGAKLDPKAVAMQIGAKAALQTAPRLTPSEDATVLIGHDAARRINTAEFHLFWLTSTPDEWAKKYSQTGGVPSEKPDACPCQPDREARDQAERLATETARLDALPTVLIDCPAEGHGRHRMATEVRSLRLTPDRRADWTAMVPALAELLPPPPRDYYGSVPEVEVQVTTCRRGKTPVAFIRVKALAERLAKEKALADKAAARAAKKQPKRLARVAAVEVVAGDAVEFTCPVHGESVEGVVEGDADDDGRLFVGCDVCEIEFSLTALGTVKKLDQAAA